MNLQIINIILSLVTTSLMIVIIIKLNKLNRK